MRFSVTLALAIMGMFSARPALADASDPAGVWRGESVCAPEASACRNERVVYYIRKVANRPDVVVIQADKIVDGKAITMGTGQWHYDRGKSTLEWRMPHQVWLLKITGSRIEGTLNREDGTVLRNMTLEKDH